jgi:thiopeptide-type bacteriocin biosynthesis protein
MLARRWTQVGLAVGPAPDARSSLLAEMEELVRASLADGSAATGFHLYKPPGIRLRLEANAGRERRLAQRVADRVDEWQRRGLVARVVPGVYEPESLLFGGVRSMSIVHRLFTGDSLAWLRLHRLALRSGASVPRAWSLSLAMLPALFHALDISDWEDLDVWDRIRTRSGRSLPEAVVQTREFAEIADGIRARWLGAPADGEWPRDVADTLGDHARAMADLGARWREEYFCTEEALIGPRAGAALFTIFHWNRAGLTLERQALLAESLARRQTI